MSSKFNRILLIDPSVVGESHILVNTGFIRLFAEISNEIIVITEESHSRSLQKYLNLTESCADINYISYRDRSNARDIVRKVITSQHIDLLFFLNLEYKEFIYYNLCGHKYYEGSRYWVLHSHLVSLNKGGLRTKMIAWLKVILLFNLFANNNFVVLGDNIEANIRRISLGLMSHKKVRSVFHPVGVSSLNAKVLGPTKSRNRDMSIVFLHGWHRLPDDRLQTLARLTETGRTKGQFNLEEIQTSFNSGPLGRSFSKSYSERLEIITSASFLLQLPTDQYSFQASGALMDMIVTRTPAIGIATDFGKDIENKIGRFGYFFDTDAELLDFMERFSDNYKTKDHQEFISNLTKGGEKLNQLARQSLANLVATPP